MNKKIRKAVVLGAGVMGSGIAAHLSNVGIPSLLLDIVPPEMTEAEKERGFTPQNPDVRNRYAVLGKKRTEESRPASLYSKEDAELISTGNFEDHLSQIGQADWVIEAVIEDADLKRRLFEKLIPFLKDGTIVSSNTSGISIQKLCDGFPPAFKERFLGTHFFNPPRYMKLLEIIPTPSTSKEVVGKMVHVGEDILGKGVVFAKDTPNFIANRIGAFATVDAIRAAIEGGYRIEEVDQITGQAIGRPKLATFKLADLVGVDVMIHVTRNLYESLPPGEREIYVLAPFVRQMFENNWLGQKSGRGFYKRAKTNHREEITVLDYEKMDYRAMVRADFSSVETCKTIDDVRERVRTMVTSPDRGGQFAWKIIKNTLLYAAERIPELSDDVLNIDRAMRWGYNWELGPFELWDAIGVKESVRRMEKEGDRIPPLVEELLGGGRTSFYETRKGRVATFVFGSGYRELEERAKLVVLSSLRERNKTVISNPVASLVDLGDGVACLEFHSKMNSIGAETIRMLRDSLKEVDENFEGMVIGNQAQNFSAGADLALMNSKVQEGRWDDIEVIVKDFQDAMMCIKYFEKPVVAAPFGMTLGGGCEVCLASARIQAAAETYMGLVEVGVGLLPAGGGIKELLIRSTEGIPPGVMNVELMPFARKDFETVVRCKVGTSAKESRFLGYMRATDGITINRDFQIHDAKNAVLDMVKSDYRSPRQRNIKVIGERGYALLQLGLLIMKEGGYISPFDEHVGKKVAYVMSGGALPDGTEVREQYLLDLEREAFLSLCGEPKTRERIEHMLKKGKALRN